MHKKLIILQDGTKDCGACCLLSVIRYFGGNISLNKLTEITNTNQFGTNFYNIKEACDKIGLTAQGFKINDLNTLNNSHCPFICQIKKDHYLHFVVVYKIQNNKLLIMDPALGKITLTKEEFINLWTSYIMIFTHHNKLPNYKEENYINKLLVSILLNNKKMILNCFMLTILFCIFSISYSFYMKIIIDKVINQDISLLIVVSLSFLIIIIFRSITYLFRNQILLYLNYKIDAPLFINSFKKILLLPYNYYKNKPTGEIISRINDLSYLKQITTKLLTTVFLDFILLVISVICLYLINEKLFFISLMIALIHIIIIFIYQKIIKNKINNSQKDMAKTNAYLTECINGYETIKNLHIESKISEKLQCFYLKAQSNILNYNIIYNIVTFLKDIIGYVGMLIINYIGCVQIMNNNFTIGSLLTFNTILSYFLNPLNNFIDLSDEYLYVKNALKRANNLYDVECEDISKKNNLIVKGNIEIKNLNFSLNNKQMILKNINLKIKDKEKVLLLGSSGSGKSTLMKILYKYYTPKRNEITINKIDINDFTISDIRSQVVYISQNEILYTDTISNNIIQQRNINYEEFLKICKLTEVNEIIKNSSLNYDMLIEENGVNISGGERQRIILARALLKPTNLIIIDEGLSQLDINLERRILKRIFNHFKDKTIIIISHRLNNMDLYDKVIKLSDGEIKDYYDKGGEVY